MSGIYLHIPFCKQACYYCNFHFSTSLSQREALVQCLLQEMEWQRHYLQGQRVETIYFGGGTPSLLPEADLHRLLERLHQLFSINAGAEITLEANPDDLHPEKLRALQQMGVNRLSIGVQSFHEADLRWMNRAHDSRQARTCIYEARAAGFENLSIDLIYGGPTLSDESWEQNVQEAVALQVPHLSCYALTVEPGTALDHFIRKKKVPPVDADKAARHFELLMRWMEAAGYEHYEISNFALPGRYSRHNSSYWQGLPYLGLGPSAHSYNGHSRQWNIANNTRYIQSIMQGAIPFEKEELTPVIMLNEYIMTSLRTAAGCNLQVVAERFGEDKKQALFRGSQKFIQDGRMAMQGTSLVLTREGKLFADGIAAELFF